MSNLDLRMSMLSHGLKHWQVAKAVGVDPATLSVWLRHELTGERLEKVQAAIQSLTEDGESRG